MKVQSTELLFHCFLLLNGRVWPLRSCLALLCFVYAHKAASPSVLCPLIIGIFGLVIFYHIKRWTASSAGVCMWLLCQCNSSLNREKSAVNVVKMLVQQGWPEWCPSINQRWHWPENPENLHNWFLKVVDYVRFVDELFCWVKSFQIIGWSGLQNCCEWFIHKSGWFGSRVQLADLQFTDYQWLTI